MTAAREPMTDDDDWTVVGRSLCESRSKVQAESSTKAFASVDMSDAPEKGAGSPIWYLQILTFVFNLVRL